jgi:hypothetical protein
MLDSFTEETSIKWYPFHLTRYSRFRPLSCLDVATLALGSRPRQRELQGCGPKGSSGVKPKGSPGAKAKRSPRPKARGSPGVTSHTPGNVRKCEGVNFHTPKATPTLGDGVPVDSRNFRERLQETSMDCDVLYIIGKLLKRRYLKWARIAHLESET